MHADMQTINAQNFKFGIQKMASKIIALAIGKVYFCQTKVIFPVLGKISPKSNCSPYLSMKKKQILQFLCSSVKK